MSSFGQVRLYCTGSIFALVATLLSVPCFGSTSTTPNRANCMDMPASARNEGGQTVSFPLTTTVQSSGEIHWSGQCQRLTDTRLDPPLDPSVAVHSAIATPDVGATVANPGQSSEETSPAELARLLNLPDRLPMPVVDNIDMSQGLGAIFSDLDSLQDQIAGQQRPSAAAAFRYSNESDSLDIRQEEGSSNLFFNNGLTRVGLSGQAINYDPKIGPTINQYAAGLTGHDQIGSFASITGEAYLDRVTSRNLDYYRLTYDVYLTLKPSDYIRIDLDSNRRLFDNIISLQIAAVAQSFGGSVDYLPNSGTRLTGRVASSSFNDGNWRRTEELEGLVRVDSSPLIELGLRGTNFHFTRLLNDGYFNPRNYTSSEAVFHLNVPLSKVLNADFAGSAGVEDSSPGGTKPLVKAAFKVFYRLTDRWTLNSEASYFSSRTSNSTGFARASILVGLNYHL